MSGWASRFGKFVFRLGAVLAALALAAGFFGGAHPVFDAVSHFQAHLGAILIVVGLCLVALGPWIEGLLALTIGLSALLAVVLTGWGPGPGRPVAAITPIQNAAPSFRLLQLNLLKANQTPEAVLSLIGRVRPDVITLQEVSGLWIDKLALLAAYPHRIVCPVDIRSGDVAILSLRPFAEGSKPVCLELGTMAKATIDFGGRPAEVATVHLLKPWPFNQSAQVDRLVAGELGHLRPTAILTGDFNASQWSHTGRRVAAAAEMLPVAGIGPTWLHERMPPWQRHVGLSIDQIFVKGRIAVHSARSLEPVGSDHLPLLLEFSVTPQGPALRKVVTAEAEARRPLPAPRG